MEEKLEKKAQSYLEKIKKDKIINSFIYLNPNLIEEARQIEKKSKKGKLYGKIIAVKANTYKLREDIFIVINNSTEKFKYLRYLIDI